MYKRKKVKKLGRKKSHREALVRNLVQSLVLHGYVTTTLAKAKVLKQEFDRFISYFWRENIDDMTKRRYAQGYLYSSAAVDRLFNDILPETENRVGGYTTLKRVKDRPGDGATLAIVGVLRDLPAATLDEDEDKVKKNNDESK